MQQETDKIRISKIKVFSSNSNHRLAHIFKIAVTYRLGLHCKLITRGKRTRFYKFTERSNLFPSNHKQASYTVFSIQTKVFQVFKISDL